MSLINAYFKRMVTTNEWTRVMGTKTSLFRTVFDSVWGKLAIPALITGIVSGYFLVKKYLDGRKNRTVLESKTSRLKEFWTLFEGAMIVLFVGSAGIIGKNMKLAFDMTSMLHKVMSMLRSVNASASVLGGYFSGKTEVITESAEEVVSRMEKFTTSDVFIEDLTESEVDDEFTNYRKVLRNLDTIASVYWANVSLASNWSRDKIHCISNAYIHFTDTLDEAKDSDDWHCITAFPDFLNPRDLVPKALRIFQRNKALNQSMSLVERVESKDDVESEIPEFDAQEIAAYQKMIKKEILDARQTLIKEYNHNLPHKGFLVTF
jgi:hypothetical protein